MLVPLLTFMLAMGGLDASIVPGPYSILAMDVFIPGAVVAEGVIPGAAEAEAN